MGKVSFEGKEYSGEFDLKSNKETFTICSKSLYAYDNSEPVTIYWKEGAGKIKKKDVGEQRLFIKTLLQKKDFETIPEIFGVFWLKKDLDDCKMKELYDIILKGIYNEANEKNEDILPIISLKVIPYKSLVERGLADKVGELERLSVYKNFEGLLF